MAETDRQVRGIRTPLESKTVVGRSLSGRGDAGMIPFSTFVGQILDELSAAQGSIIYRGTNAWTALAPGTNGQVLVTQGAGADPIWSSAGSGLTHPQVMSRVSLGF